MTAPSESPLVVAAREALRLERERQDAERIAAETAALERATARLTEVLAGVSVKALTLTAEGSMVLATDGVVYLGVRSDGQVWRVTRNDDTGWQTVGPAPIGSLLDLARQLGVSEQVHRG